MTSGFDVFGQSPDPSFGPLVKLVRKGVQLAVQGSALGYRVPEDLDDIFLIVLKEPILFEVKGLESLGRSSGLEGFVLRRIG